MKKVVIALLLTAFLFTLKSVPSNNGLDLNGSDKAGLSNIVSRFNREVVKTIQPDVSKIDVEDKASFWDFNTNSEGWVLNSSLTGYVSSGIFDLKVTGQDPFMVSPNNLNLNTANFSQLEITLQNNSNASSFQLFWITTTDGNWNQAKSIWFDVNGYDASFKQYTVFLLQNSLWKGTIKQIRIDTGDNIGSMIKIDKILLSNINFSLDNGTILLKQDLSRGGAISYISKSGANRSIVNIADEGRYVQQSYYAGNSINRIAEGQSPSWSPWSWNPIQVGDAFSNRAKILAYSKSGNSTYVKCIPMQWDMNNRPAEAEMEQWTELNGNIIKVRNRLSCHRTDNIYGEGHVNHQEVPAVYPISALKNLYSYFGDTPFTNGSLSNIPVVNLSSGFWGVYSNNKVSENWMAFVDDNLWGMGVYTPITKDFLAGMAGSPGGEATSSSTSYIAPVKSEVINKNTVYEYTYYLVIGNLNQIRSSIYQIHGSYTLTVTDGIIGTSGTITTGSFAANTSITITANTAPTGKVFDKWVVNSGSPVITDINSTTTTLKMPANATSVTATYKNIDALVGYIWCANENQSYALSGTCDVAYGANGQFYYKYNQTGTINFNNASFGDPVPGVIKSGFYKTVNVSIEKLSATCDNSYKIYLNEALIGSGNNWTKAQNFTNISLLSGKNVIAVKAVDAGGVAGLLAELKLSGQRIGTNSSWKVSLNAPTGWKSASYNDASWAAATEYGAYGVSPWFNNVAGMSTDTPAKWIWSSDANNHDVVYFRYIIQNSPGSNAALNKPTVQSSTAWEGVSSRAVDGNTNGIYFNNSVTHTNLEAQPWWKVDLGASYSINRVRVWNRAECGDRLSNFHVDYLSNTGSMITSSTFSGTVGTYADINLFGSGVHYVRVQLNGSNYLSLAEVEVFTGSQTVQTAISEENIPKSVTLSQNYPNPFNPFTTIKFALPKTDNVKLAVLNANGETVKVLTSRNYSAGNHSVDFDGTGLNSGVYFYQLVTPEKTITKKMILMK